MARSEPSSSMMLQLRIFLLYFPENLLPPWAPPPPIFWSARPFTFRRLKNLSILRVTFNSQVWQDFYSAALWVSRADWGLVCGSTPTFSKKSSLWAGKWTFSAGSHLPSGLWESCAMLRLRRVTDYWLGGGGGGVQAAGRGGRGRGEVAELHARLHWLLQSGSSQVRARHCQPTPAGPANTTEHIRSEQNKLFN